MWEALLKHFTSRGVVFSDEQKAAVESVFKLRKYRKGQYVLQAGEVCKYETFVLKGMLRTYLVDDKGQEHIMRFAPEDWWAGDMDSFYTGNPSNYNIDCLEDSDVLHVTCAHLETLINSIPQLNNYYRILYRSSVIAYHRRVTAALCNSALERYQQFVKNYPFIEQRVPNHQIASYLGITPQSLSRLRKQAVSRKS